MRFFGDVYASGCRQSKGCPECTFGRCGVGQEAALLMGYELMESSKAGTWSECYYYVMPERAEGPRVVWEEQQAFRVSVPVVLDADVPWRRK